MFLSSNLEESLDIEISKAALSLLDRAFYMKVWQSRQHLCECCKVSLYEPRLYMFHHILEKRRKQFTHDDYSRYRHCQWNIMLLCWECHDAYERNPDTRPFIHKAKEQLLYTLAQDFQYDSDYIWLTHEPVDVSLINLLFPNIVITLNI